MDFDWPSWTLGVFPGVAMGALASWAITAHYYRKGKADADLQLTMLRTVLITLEQQGIVRLARNEGGAITGGRAITVVVNESMNLGSSFSAEVKCANAEVRGQGTVSSEDGKPKSEG